MRLRTASGTAAAILAVTAATAFALVVGITSPSGGVSESAGPDNLLVIGKGPAALHTGYDWTSWNCPDRQDVAS
ncbi:hypothetical protein OHA21_00500 [Actinoplanes sp. NBC_00393]|uniref:hypothetical protein n=1 Tax=Actinoplanes sp. NBC_00393 TaxID=2975953 RepID=UPI002E22B889